jgi:hypothetical protein
MLLLLPFTFPTLMPVGAFRLEFPFERLAAAREFDCLLLEFR